MKMFLMSTLSFVLICNIVAVEESVDGLNAF